MNQEQTPHPRSSVSFITCPSNEPDITKDEDGAILRQNILKVVTVNLGSDKIKSFLY